jgi:drug/metabolite transporter (DMT)-like permease
LRLGLRRAGFRAAPIRLCGVLSTTSSIGERAWIAEVGLIGIAAVWGLTFPVVQDAVALIPVFTFLAYRFLAAAAVVAVVSRSQLRTLSREGLKSGLLVGVFLTSGYAFQTLGLERTSSSNAGFITGMMVVLTPVFGALFLHHKAGGTAWVAAGVSAVGLLFLSGVGGSGAHLGGDFLVFLCACSFAFHILATDHAVKGHDVRAILVVQLGVCGLFSLIVATMSGDLVVPGEASVWMALAITSIVASALGFFVQMYAQRHTSPARTALILASEPVFAGLFAYLLKGETLTPAQWVGAGLILASIVAVELVPALRPSRPIPEA